MASLPNTLDDAIVQAKGAVQAALQDGYGGGRLQVELVFPELKVMPIAQQFYPLFQDMGLQFKVFFPDAGAAALARRDWGNPDFTIRGLGELADPVAPDDELFLVVEPSAVEVAAVEDLCNQAVGKAVVLLNPRLEEVAIIGIGYAARQLRERFLNTLESCYYLRPLEGAALLRCYPDPWQVWRETEPGQYELLAELPQRPVGEALENILNGLSPSGDEATATPAAPGGAPRARKGFLSELQQFIRALTQ